MKSQYLIHLSSLGLKKDVLFAKTEMLNSVACTFIIISLLVTFKDLL